MVINRSPRTRRLFALAASVAVALSLVAGAVGGSASPAAADEQLPGVRGMLLGDRTLPATGGTVTEQVMYENLTRGLYYTVQVEFRDLDGAETDLVEVVYFTPTAPDGSLEVELVVPESFQGRSLVAVVSLYEGSDSVHSIAVHRDLGDPRQTLTVTANPTPGVRGSLVGVTWLPWSGGTITERVAYDDLMTGQNYTVVVEMRKQDGTSTDIKSVVGIVPIAPDGNVDIEVDVPTTAAGSTLVAFVSLFKPTVDGDLVAIHHDLADPRQTVIVIGTGAVHGALIGERWVTSTGWIITEQLDYQNFTPGHNYAAFVAMRTPDGAYSDFGEVTYFIPTSPHGTLTVDVVIPATAAGQKLIATVFMFDRDTSSDAVAVHDDLTDPHQTLVVRGAPNLHSSVADKADGDRMLSAAGGTIIDTLSFDQLVPGAEYTVSGMLVRQSDASTTPLTSSRTFTAAATSGTVELEYVVPAGYAGETLVSFERLFAGTDTSIEPMAVDEQLDDPTQTIFVQTVPAQTVPTQQMLAATGSASPTLPLGLAAALLAVGLALMATRVFVANRRRASAA